LVWNFRNLRKTLRKRVYIQSIRKIPDKQIQNFMFRIREYKTRRCVDNIYGKEGSGLQTNVGL
jgi:hypothetical protein